MSFNLVVFDDNADHVQILLDKVAQLPRSAELDVEAIADLDELRLHLLAGSIDILLMDIRIEGSTTDGIELVRSCVPKHSAVQTIFVTGFDTYHSSVYRAKHTWFLMKPVKQEELEEAVDAALSNLAEHPEHQFIVRTVSGERLIKPSALRYVESRKRTLFFHVGNKTISATGKLSDLMEQLPSYFVQCHKSFAANMGFIDELGRDDLVLTTGELVPVSQRRRAHVRRAFIDYVGRVLAGGDQG